MRCPDCREEGDVKWMLRHQKISEEDVSTNANVVTILCTKCGKNASVFIEDYLPEMFSEWDETPELIQQYLEEQRALEEANQENENEIIEIEEVVDDMPTENDQSAESNDN